MLLRARAPAKVNLTLQILGRRADGFHELDSIVAFAGCAADALTLEPGAELALDVSGPFAGPAGEGSDNLVLRAARAAAERIEGLRLGRFALVKRIPVAAGLGGGSADAAAALRLIAEANEIEPDDAALVDAAAAVGSDVPACLISHAARMTGRGEAVERIAMAPLAAVLANPMKGLATVDVFLGLGLAAGEIPDENSGEIPAPRQRGSREAFDAITQGRNDLEPPARALLPEIGVGLDALAGSQGCRLARMSGSGATVFGLYDDNRAARRAARALHKALPGWWIRPTLLR